MSKFCPVYPKPKKTRASFFTMFFGKRHSWLDGLFERSYHMKMGEVHLPGVDLYMVNEPSLVRKVLVDEAVDFPKHAMLGEVLKPLLGESIFTTNGAQWKRQRAMMDDSFGATRLKVVFPLMLQAATDMLERLDQIPDGASYDVDVEMTHVTADIIFRTILSVPLKGEDAYAIFRAFTLFQELAPKLMTPVLFRIPAWLTFGLSAKKSRTAALQIRSVLERFIRPRFDAFQQGDPGQFEDILASLLAAKDPQTGTGFNFDELVDQVAMLFLAGHETSASSLGWSLYLIANSPQIQQRMHLEVQGALGNSEPTYADMRSTELTRNVFKETLRLYPPVGFFARQTVKTEHMRDKVLPKLASIVISPWLIHRHRELWHAPDDFDPDRYDTPAARESLKCAYLPFSLGPRVCMGAAFALQEANLILAMLVRRYRFEALPGVTPRLVGRLTIRSQNGIRLRIIKR